MKNKLKKLLTGCILIIGLVIMVSGCKKSYDEPIKKDLVNIKFGLSMSIKEKPITKSFDENTWSWVFNSNQYELKLSNSQNSYSVLVSINELKTGNIIMKVQPGIYLVEYETEHGTEAVGNSLDIKIYESVNIDGNTNIILNGILTDAMIVVEVENVADVEMMNNNNVLGQLYHDTNGQFFWGYIPENTADKFRLTWVLTGSQDIYDCSMMLNGQAYIFSGASVHGFEINIPDIIVNRITL